MTIALVGAFATIAALIAATVWIVSIVRTDGRERAEALRLAEKLQGDVNITYAAAAAKERALVEDIRRQTRRADALEDFIRSDRISRHGVVDDGTDLLLAELSVVAAGAYDPFAVDTHTPRTTAPGGDSGTVATVPDDQAQDRSAGGGDGDLALDETLPGGETP